LRPDLLAAPEAPTMKPIVLRDTNDARRFLLQGLWWQRVLPPSASTVRSALEWAMEAASGGQPLPPPGFIADVGHVAFGEDWDARGRRDARPVPGLPVNLLSTYEDHVLGKVYADWTFTRASDALRQYKGRDRARGLAFFLNQFRERSGFAGVIFSPGVIKAALDSPPEEALVQGHDSLTREGADELLEEMYSDLIAAARRTAEVLGPEDVFMLERGRALDPEGERLALRQVLQAAAQLEATLPRTRVRPKARRMEVPTRILDEDTYPVGGFTSISTRGTIESLLHSQLAYMEKDERPDLFDIKFVRDELLYYSRDENQFLRRRRTFVFVLSPDLVQTRFKDPELPYQRGVLLLALLQVAVLKLSEWLSTDALSFRVLFTGEGDAEPLKAERELLGKLLEEAITLGTAKIDEKRVSPRDVAALCTNWARRSLCHCLVIGTQPQALAAADTVVTRLQVDGPRPALADGDEAPEVVEGDDPLECWGRALEQLLQRWV
jgi:hypothetical protein